MCGGGGGVLLEPLGVKLDLDLDLDFNLDFGFEFWKADMTLVRPVGFWTFFGRKENILSSPSLPELSFPFFFFFY